VALSYLNMQASNRPTKPASKRTGLVVTLVIIIIVAVILAVLVGYLFLRPTPKAATTTTASLGQSCTSTPCAVGLSCELGVCKLQLNSPCENSGVNCPNGTICVTTYGSAQCKSNTLGKCKVDTDCAAGGSSGNKCTSFGQCWPPTTCTTNSDCFSINGPAFGCVSGTCMLLGPKNIGSTCNPLAGEGCYPPGTCINNKCVLPAGSGTCTVDSDCAPQSLCESGTCVGYVGADCTSNSQCSAPNTCISNVCRPPSTCFLLSDCGLTTAGIPVGCSGGFCATFWP